MHKNDCLFCKIVKGESPCYKVYEDEKTLAFLDINPVTRGHTLVIPKKHSRNLFDIQEQDLSHLVSTIKKVAEMIKEKLGAEGINILQANEKAAEQIFFHTHFHVIPRWQDDNIQVFPDKKYTKEDFEEILREIHKGW